MHQNENESDCPAEKALKGLLREFRTGPVGQRQWETGRIQEHLAELARQWDQRFPGLPEAPYAYASFRGVFRRGLRDAYLKNVIVKLLGNVEGEGPILVNPVCVWGRHARDLARRLPAYTVIATDIRPEMDQIYRFAPWHKTPQNYDFRQEDIFEPALNIRPKAVVFFGACGSLSDAAMDYATKTKADYMICRTCCHDNIGGNTQIVRQFSLLNLLFRLKNLAYAHQCRQKTGEYFSPRYTAQAYPHSETAKQWSNATEFMRIARRSVDSDVCRGIIDLDRFLHMTEAGYEVWYRAEMFVARKGG